jgi:uncharacterized protein YcaQ
VEGQLRAAGVAKSSRFGIGFDGVRPAGWDRVLAALVREGVAVPVTIEGLRGTRYAHAEALEAKLRPRTMLVSPFDRVVYDRDRTEEIFNFRYRIEIYVPKHKREFGYFVLPVLSGDRLIGRVDPRLDRETRTLHVNAVYAEPDAPASAGPAVAKAIVELAAWARASDVVLGKTPAVWRKALRAAM